MTDRDQSNLGQSKSGQVSNRMKEGRTKRRGQGDGLPQSERPEPSPAAAPTSYRSSIEECCINTIRTLSMDAVQQANSGHPGAPMALAPVAYTVWQHFLRFDPEDPIWPNRDRFVLSNGHASM